MTTIDEIGRRAGRDALADAEPLANADPASTACSPSPRPSPSHGPEAGAGRCSHPSPPSPQQRWVSSWCFRTTSRIPPRRRRRRPPGPRQRLRPRRRWRPPRRRRPPRRPLRARPPPRRRRWSPTPSTSATCHRHRCSPRSLRHDHRRGTIERRGRAEWGRGRRRRCSKYRLRGRSGRLDSDRAAGRGAFLARRGGPGDVVYGLVYGDAMPATASMVAIALSGGRAGEVVASSPVDPNCLLELPVGVFGLGPTGVVHRSRQVGAELIGYVDTAGQPIAWPGTPPPLITIDGTHGAFDQWPGLAAEHRASPGVAGRVVRR